MNDASRSGTGSTTAGTYPSDDGWAWAYRFYEKVIRPREWMRRPLCAYFNPNALERAGDGAIYRLLGVQYFGRVIPTGGILIRRLTGARMAPYTLKGTSLGAAAEFRYRTCLFEAAHLPFFLALLVLIIDRFQSGRADLALENTVVNLAVNAYPMMHHRYTRLRIDRLLARGGDRRGHGRRRDSGGPGPKPVRGD